MGLAPLRSIPPWVKEETLRISSGFVPAPILRVDSVRRQVEVDEFGVIADEGAPDGVGEVGPNDTPLAEGLSPNSIPLWSEPARSIIRASLRQKGKGRQGEEAEGVSSRAREWRGWKEVLMSRKGANPLCS
ncbi:MAG: hypothetical protein AAGJ31_09630 [Verrucomicrobiota bacterium]